MTHYPNSHTLVFISRPKLRPILSKKRKYYKIPGELNLTLDKAKQLEFLRFDHPRPIYLPRPLNTYLKFLLMLTL